jgi:hypothetical protein
MPQLTPRAGSAGSWGFLHAVAAGTAAWDAWYGSVSNAVVSAIYLVMLLIEVFWWPRRRCRLLENIGRACG